MKSHRVASRGVAIAACALLAGGLAACGSSESESEGATQRSGGSGQAVACTSDYKMGMLVMAQLRLFDTMVAGYREGFADETGIPEGEIQLDVQNAQGDPGNFQSMARTFASGDDQLIGVIGTPPTLALLQATREKPIVTISVSDPRLGGAVRSPEEPGTNVTGSIDITPEDDIVAGILEIQPDARSIGTIYMAGNDFLVEFNRAIAAAADRYGVELVETAVSNSNELQSAARSMQGKVDAVLIGRDGAVAAGLPAIAAEAERNRLPIYLAYTGPDSLVPGVVGGFGSDEREVGRLAGEVAGQICRGADPATTPFAWYRDHRWQFRRDSLAANGLEVPAALAQRSDFVAG